MALPALATLDDLAARGVSVGDAETVRVETFLASASAAVRDAAGCAISETTSTISLPGDGEPWLSLPAPPVTAVDEVLVDAQAVTDWRLVGGWLWRPSGWQPTVPCEVTVTYTHGLPEVPADLVDLVCRIAAAILVASRSSEDGTGIAAGDIRSERIGDYSVTYGDDGGITELELPDHLRRRLAARFGGGIGLVRSR
ncbi:hypothetical protein ACIRPH_29975 [Nocardiopsis sp. NPDC101807]|uniref:hypothetical protein n=1 Tax=Nocardiopsis sp. NPDC101807 TaxID=3364339 RepID=UPI00381FCFDA